MRKFSFQNVGERVLKGAQARDFRPLFFNTILCYLLRIFSDEKDFVNLFILNLLFDFLENIRKLSLRMHCVHVH